MYIHTQAQEHQRHEITHTRTAHTQPTHMHSADSCMNTHTLENEGMRIHTVWYAYIHILNHFKQTHACIRKKRHNCMHYIRKTRKSNS